MIYDIKVFDGKGNLKEVIDGYKVFQKGYDIQMSPYLMERSKATEHFTCRYCKKEFPLRAPGQFCCAQPKCVYKRGLILRPYKKPRKIKCRICHKSAEVRHSRQITCSKECSVENNRKKNLKHRNKLNKDKKNGTKNKKKKGNTQLSDRRNIQGDADQADHRDNGKGTCRNQAVGVGAEHG